MKKELNYCTNSITYINSLLNRKKFKGTIIVTGQNFIDGGPWRILNDAIENLSEYKKDYLIIAIVYKKLEKKYENVINLICKNSKISWLHRIFYEKFEFNEFSKSIIFDIDIWISMHDITPRVKAKKIITYYHNASPFWKPRIYQIFLSPVTALFMLFYLKICAMNIYKNDTLIVQQNWMKQKLLKKFPKLNIVVCRPISIKRNEFNLKEKIRNFTKYKKLSKKPFLICPTTPRVFKNIETAIKAAEKIKGYNLLITINGNENLYTRYLKLISSNYKNIFFIGYVDKYILDYLYKKSAAIIFPSQLESWGLPITESILLNKLIFVPDLDYAKETCGNYKLAVFFNSGSYLALREKINNNLILGKKENSILKNNIKNKNLDNIYSYSWNNLWRKLF